MTVHEITFSKAIEKIMLANGYFASLQHIYKEFPKYRALTGKTPFKTIQERVQRDEKFTRIGVGVYALTEFFQKVQKSEIPRNKKEKTEFQHKRIQGMLLEIGEQRQYGTYTPDKKKTFDGKVLGLIASIEKCPQFTFPYIIEQSIKFIDVIWFNQRNFPSHVFEIEHSTDFRSALTKFVELQDFTTRFFLIAPEERYKKFETEIRKRAFEVIANRCNFRSYESIEKYYRGLLNYSTVRNLL
ncbi:MAG TPA: hypothetical protein HPP87_07645 [Planctomycetes bacterium]|nr:hypothetical protein [Planctomycetota bacterium]HIJ71222.1 hypothetical protein [Planctomycetota bacterium]